MSEPLIVGQDVPDVLECYGGHRTRIGIALYGPAPSCPQCDGRHRHEWVECLVPPSYAHARRCRICGGRQCDADCIERRHHSGPHITPDGKLWPVGK